MGAIARKPARIVTRRTQSAPDELCWDHMSKTIQIRNVADTIHRRVEGSRGPGLADHCQTTCSLRSKNLSSGLPWSKCGNDCIGESQSTRISTLLA